MAKRKSLTNPEKEIFNINSESRFIELALSVFNFQYNNNLVYRNWVRLLKINPAEVKRLEQIPFLPIEFFKSHKVLSAEESLGTIVFKSSSTTSQTPSRHYISRPDIYERSFLKGFETFYGDPALYCILALLPGYLERKDSSLVYMFSRLIHESGHPLSGFYLKNINDLVVQIKELKKKPQKTLLIGVSYALMDLSEKVKLNENFIVMETGGMKGKRKELIKEELHRLLKENFGVNTIHSEYGMTELLSQAYSNGGGTFETPPWMKFLIREVTDPLRIRNDFKTGGINVIDLANLYSCSFIATQDLGRLNEKGGLQLMGRYDNSDIRGCNLMLDGSA